MYYLTEEEQKRLVRKIIPQGRSMEVQEELRGWSWNKDPLDPPYDMKLGLWEIAGKYCETSRDIYLRHVEREKEKPSKAMLIGKSYHSVLSTIYPLAKKHIYLNGINEDLNVSRFLDEAREKEIDRIIKSRIRDFKAAGASQNEIDMLKKNATTLWNYEARKISTSVENVLTKQKYIKEDALIHAAIPVVVEQRLDGSFLGLSGMLSADAVSFHETIIFDVKTGLKKDFHPLTVTGYALVYESLFDVPVNVGCIGYMRFEEGVPVPRISRKFHLINEELRDWFIEERDEKMRLIYNERDPGVCENPNKLCAFYHRCVEDI